MSEHRGKRQAHKGNDDQGHHGGEIAGQGGGIAGKGLFQFVHRANPSSRGQAAGGLRCCQIVLKFGTNCKELFENIREQNALD